jgi:hypothetical protein
MPQLSTSITVAGRYAILPSAATAGTQAFRKANSIFCPVGAAPSRAWLLMLKADVDYFRNQGGSSPLTITWTQRVDGVETTLNFHGFYLHKSTRVLHGGNGDASAIHLVEFVDARAIAAAHSDCGAIAANIRSYAQDTVGNAGVRYLDGTTGYTWASLAAELWNACPGLGAFPGLPYAPDGVPQNTRFIGSNAWESLCALLDKLDCAVAHNPLAASGNYSIVSLGAPQTIPDETLSLKWNAETEDFPATDIPEKVRVYFQNHYDSYGQENDTGRVGNWSVTGAGAYIDKTTGVAGAVAGTIKSLWDDLPRLLDENNTLQNSTELDTRATARRDKWLQRQQTVRRHRIHIGLLQTILPGSQVRAVLWRCWGGESDGLQQLEAGTVTEFVSCPELITSLGANGLGGFGGSAITQPKEHYSPPDLGRHSYPNFPRLPNIVQVYHSAGTLGQEVQANGSGLHPGKVRRWVAGSLATLEDCWIRFVDDHDNLAGNVTVKDGDCFYGRLSGIETHDGATLPIYLARAGAAGDSLIRFELYDGDLELGGECDAKVCVPDGDDWTPTDTVITVMDPYDPGTWQGKEGYQGFCVPRPGDEEGRYEIVYMEEQAIFIEVELAEDRDPESDYVECYLEAWYHGREPETVAEEDDQNQPTGKKKILVYDEDKIFPRGLKECKGKAVWNDIEKRYELWICQQRALKLKGFADGDNCGDDTIPVTDVVSMYPSPNGFMPNPIPTEFLNRNPGGAFRVQNGDWVVADWDDDIEDYVVTAVELHVRTIVSNVFMDEDGCLKASKFEAAVSVCEDAPEEGDPIICTEECD